MLIIFFTSFQSTSKRLQSSASSRSSLMPYRPCWPGSAWKRSMPIWSTSSIASLCWWWWARCFPSSLRSYCIRCALLARWPTAIARCGSSGGLMASVSKQLRLLQTYQTQNLLSFRLGSCDIPLRCSHPPALRQGVGRNLLQRAQNCARLDIRSWLEIFVPARSVGLNLNNSINSTKAIQSLILSAKVCFWVQNLKCATVSKRWTTVRDDKRRFGTFKKTFWRRKFRKTNEKKNCATSAENKTRKANNKQTIKLGQSRAFQKRERNLSPLPDEGRRETKQSDIIDSWGRGMKTKFNLTIWKRKWNVIESNLILAWKKP